MKPMTGPLLKVLLLRASSMRYGGVMGLVFLHLLYPVFGVYVIRQNLVWRK